MRPRNQVDLLGYCLRLALFATGLGLFARRWCVSRQSGLKLNSKLSSIGVVRLYEHFKVTLALLMGPLVLTSTLTACGKFSVDPKLGSVAPSVSANPATAEAENKKKLEEAKKAAKEAKDAAAAADAADKADKADKAGGAKPARSEVADLFGKDAEKRDAEQTAATGGQSDAKTPMTPSQIEKAATEKSAGEKTVTVKVAPAKGDSLNAEEQAQAARQAELQRLAAKSDSEKVSAEKASVSASPDSTAAPAASEVVAAEILDIQKKVVAMSDLRTVKLLLGELTRKGINPQRAKLSQIKATLDSNKSLDSADAEWLMNLRTEYQLTDGISIDAYLERVDVWPASLVITLAAATKPGAWGGDSEAEIARDKAVLAKVIEDLNVSTKESVVAARKIRAAARANGKIVEAEALVAALAPELSIAIGKPVTEKQFAELIEDSKINILSHREAGVILSPRGATDENGKEVTTKNGTTVREVNP